MSGIKHGYWLMPVQHIFAKQDAAGPMYLRLHSVTHAFTKRTKQKVLRVYLYFLICLFASSLNAQKNPSVENVIARKFDSLKTRLAATSADTERVSVLNVISKFCWKKGMNDSSLKYADSALKVSEKINYKNGIAISYYNIGLAFQNLGNYAEALKSYYSALKLKRESGDIAGMAANYNAIGIIYWYEHDYDAALQNLSESLRLKQQSGDRKGIANAYNNIGNVYHDKGNYSEALVNFLTSLEIKKAEGADKFSLGNSYSNIGSCYARQNNVAMALKYNFTALQLRKEIGDADGIAITCINIGDIYLFQKKIADAGKYLNEGLELALRSANKSTLHAAYSGLYTLDSLKKDYRQAYIHYKLFIAYGDSLVNEENTRKSVISQMQYEFDRKEAEARAVQTKKDAVEYEEKRRQRIILWCVAAGFALVAFFSVFVFRAYSQKKKSNIEITQQKTVIEEKQKEILDSIHYARRIQRALITSEKYIERKLKALKA